MISLQEMYNTSVSIIITNFDLLRLCRHYNCFWHWRGCYVCCILNLRTRFRTYKMQNMEHRRSSLILHTESHQISLLGMEFCRNRTVQTAKFVCFKVFLKEKKTMTKKIKYDIFMSYHKQDASS